MDFDSDSAPSPSGSSDADGALSVAPQPPPPTLVQLLLICLKIGMVSFGGGLSGWFYQEFVRRNHWICEDDFAAMMAVSQMLPGPNVLNLVIAMADQLRGFPGVAVCVFGFIVGPFFAVIGLSTLFQRISDVGLLSALTDGIAFAALGLILIMALNGALRVSKFPPSLVVVAVTGITVGLLQFPLLLVVLVMAPVSVALTWWRIKNA